jgi:hypothetical protein
LNSIAFSIPHVSQAASFLAKFHQKVKFKNQNQNQVSFGFSNHQKQEEK